MATAVTTTTAWEIDIAHTEVEFSVKHMMFSTVKGRFGNVRGMIHTNEHEPARSSVEVEIDASSIDTRDETRDAHLRSDDFLDVESHPLLTFTSTRVEPRDDDQLRLFGDLTIRGQTRQVTLDATYNGRGINPYGQEIVAYTAWTTISRQDFGLTWNVALETGGVLVSDEVKITLDIQAARQA